MVSIVAIVEGFILAVIFTVILIIFGAGTLFGEPAVLIGFLLAGIIVGYISYSGFIDGLINGALMGVAGAIIIWILSLFQGQIAAFSVALTTYVPINTPQTLILVIVVGAVGGFIGALLLRLNLMVQRYRERRANRNRKDDKDKRDDKDRKDVNIGRRESR
jgi:amino acid transporter